MESMVREVIKENEEAFFLHENQLSEETIKTVPQQHKEIQESTRIIRVLLLNSGYESKYHEKIELQLNGGYCLQKGQQVETIQNQTVTIGHGYEWGEFDHLQFIPESDTSSISILSLERSQGSPSYSGILHIYREEQGLYMVNELSLEEYLAAVVPSEMPSYFEKEALKAQAVCARTYAAVQIKKGELEAFHADVDDSVSYQVYQNYAKTPESVAAVEETKGEIITQKGKPIDAYYFSTSHGETNTDQVWEASVPAAYLQNVKCEYDSYEPWYRWCVVFSQTDLNRAVQKVYPAVNHVSEIKMSYEAANGSVAHLHIMTDQGEYIIENEYNIRTVLAPSGLVIERQDGTKVTGSSLLPSAHFTIETVENEGEIEYHINGGGFGHGVGMSQNGAQNMAKLGMTYQEIIHYFYKDVEIITWEE